MPIIDVLISVAHTNTHTHTHTHTHTEIIAMIPLIITHPSKGKSLIKEVLTIIVI